MRNFLTVYYVVNFLPDSNGNTTTMRQRVRHRFEVNHCDCLDFKKFHSVQRVVTSTNYTMPMLKGAVSNTNLSPIHGRYRRGLPMNKMNGKGRPLLLLFLVNSQRRPIYRHFRLYRRVILASILLLRKYQMNHRGMTSVGPNKTLNVVSRNIRERLVVVTTLLGSLLCPDGEAIVPTIGCVKCGAERFQVYALWNYALRKLYPVRSRGAIKRGTKREGGRRGRGRRHRTSARRGLWRNIPRDPHYQ